MATCWTYLLDCRNRLKCSTGKIYFLTKSTVFWFRAAYMTLSRHACVWRQLGLFCQQNETTKCELRIKISQKMWGLKLFRSYFYKRLKARRKSGWRSGQPLVKRRVVSSNPVDGFSGLATGLWFHPTSIGIFSAGEDKGGLATLPYLSTVWLK